ncbi:hypothetical protein F5X68DRAFT_211816 [Plectosphaerella plurivora]|uniref:Uncharacterized protein n=1 Tax=Plectosphaerella plurivora TaxID=936078 RepID=A0A9P9A813_9PEZI|nr:hypothetical protein F5X68DRAFT_211816 [Plectosphaerella plurivora]
MLVSVPSTLLALVMFIPYLSSRQSNPPEDPESGPHATSLHLQNSSTPNVPHAENPAQSSRSSIPAEPNDASQDESISSDHTPTRQPGDL